MNEVKEVVHVTRMVMEINDNIHKNAEWRKTGGDIGNIVAIFCFGDDDLPKVE